MGDCVCNSGKKYRDKYTRTRKKYENLRRHHQKLLSVSIELTQVLEEYVRGQRSPNVTETLVLCSKIYPSLFSELSARTKDISLEETESRPKQNIKCKEDVVANSPLEEDTNIVKVEEIAENKADNQDKEYFEGFWSRPKLSRTPTN